MAGKRLFSNFIVLILSGLTASAIMEFMTRIMSPISLGTKKADFGGMPIDAFWRSPGLTYRQVTEEYDALASICEEGYRVPIVRNNPEVVFLGDSFTFGQGVSDEETFVPIFSDTTGVSCANLAEPGNNYFRYDQHFNARGTRRIAEFLIDWYAGK